MLHIDGLVHDCGNSIANAMELPQSCTKPSISPSMQWMAVHHIKISPGLTAE